MRLRGALRAVALAGAAALAGPADVAPAQTSAAQRDWSRTVVATPEGGFRMGNPAARVKLVEYGSLTCGHCANFARAAMEPLVATYVKSGRVSYEFRNYILNGLDVTATLLARCGGPAHFFPISDRFFETQGQWMGRVGSLTQEQKDEMNAAPVGERLVRLAEATGLTQMAAQYGLAPIQAKKCLADQAALDRLGSIVEAASAQGVEGTPTFFLNGANIGVHTWATLEPILRDSAG